MIALREGDRGPTVVLLQILLNTRPPQARLLVDGSFGRQTRLAVQAFQPLIPTAPTGIVGAVEWQAAMRLLPFSTFDHTDVDDAITALAQGPEAFSASLAAGHQYGIIVNAALSQSRAPAASTMAGMSNAVGVFLARAAQAGARTPLGLLRVFGHGNRGLQMLAAGHGVEGGAGSHRSALTPTVTRQMRGELKKLASVFRPYGSAELHGCHVAEGDQGRLLLRDLAEAWGVPVSAGRTRQRVGSGQNFRFEGPVVTIFPAGLSLQSWAARAEQACAFTR